MIKTSAQIQQTKKYFLYARKSQEAEERQALSIEAQLAELKNFAQQNDLQIVDVLTESKSARIPGRPAFNLLLERIQQEGIKGILAWHPDRLARNAVDAGKIVHLLDTGKLTSLKFPTFWFENTSQGLFMLSIAFGQSKYYSDNLSENVKRGIRQKLRRGEYPSIAPLGYQNDLRTHTIVKDPQTFNSIQQGFKAYASGEHTFSSLAKFLADRKVYGRFKGRPVAISVVQTILANPFYYGHFRYKGELHEGIHEPMISKKLFDQVQKVMKQRSRPTRPKDQLKPFAYRGLMKCGECGYSITAEEQKGHHYYRCTKKRAMNQSWKCSQPYVREEKVTKQINRQIRKVSLAKDWAEKMLAELKKEKQNSTQSLNSFVCQKEQESGKVEKKMEKLLDSYLDGLLAKEEYVKKKNQLLPSKAKIEESLKLAKQKKNHWLEPCKKWILTAKSVNLIADSEDLKQKAIFLKENGSNCVLKDKKLDISWQKPWARLTARPTVRTWQGW